MPQPVVHFFQVQSLFHQVRQEVTADAIQRAVHLPANKDELLSTGQYLFLCSDPLLDPCVLRLMCLHQYYYFSIEVAVMSSRSPGLEDY